MADDGELTAAHVNVRDARRLHALEAENAKLRKINRALMERVESGPGNQGGAYDTFQHQVYLAEQVRERTEALNLAMSELKRSNQALKLASGEAEQAHQHLRDAIESISDAMVLYDRDRRLVLSNSRFRQFWEGSGLEIAPGLSLPAINAHAQACGLIDRFYDNEDGGEIVGREEVLGDGKVFRLKSGSWVQMSERQTGDGGLVVLYKDITALIENERALREKALAQKSRLLQNTLDNLSQGVVLVNQWNQVQTWNQRFVELTALPAGQVTRGEDFETLMARTEVAGIMPACSGDEGPPLLEREQVLSDGRVLEIRTHPMPGGGFVNTYTDITDRSRYARALEASERRIRLITDAVPALIAYVDADLRFQFTNRAYENWYGWSRESLLGRHLVEVLPAEQYARLKPYIQRALNGEVVSFEIADPAVDGQERYVVKSYVPSIGAEDERQGFYVLIQDITERRRTAEELKLSHQHLEQRVVERTAELTAVNARLLEAKREADHANYTKTKFLAAASHDLLQPMNAARLFAASLLDQDLPSKSQSLAQSLNYSLEDVEALLGAVVDISKLDAGVVKPDITSFSVSGLLRNLANEYATLANNVGLAFRFVGTDAVIRSDSQLLARILRNLLSNAIRYTPKGRILFGCRRVASGLRIEVWDTGIGIPADKCQEIFLEFNRLCSDNSAQDKGLGLGLAIVDKIAGILGHRIDLRSKPGRGSMFSVEVPYGQLDSRSAKPLSGAAPLVNFDLSDKRILVLDNEKAICEGMETLLGGWGCEVWTALSQEQALNQLQLMPHVDLIIADYHLDNGRNGLDAAAVLQAHLDYEVPVVMITANYTNELKQAVRDRGYRLMNKPVKPAKLKALLHHLLAAPLPTAAP